MDKRIIPACFLIFFWTLLSLSGQAIPPAEEISEVETVPVMIDDMVLFLVVGIRTYPAAERARLISQRIKKIAADPTVKTDSLAAVEGEGFTTLMAGDNPIMRVFETDAAREAKGLSRQIVANLYLEKTRQAIDKYRRDREPDRLLRSGLTAGGATVGLFVVLFLFLFSFRRLMSRIESKTKAKIILLQSKSRDLLTAEKLGNALTGLLRAARLILVFAVVYVYLDFVFSLFPWDSPSVQATRRLCPRSAPENRAGGRRFYPQPHLDPLDRCRRPVWTEARPFFFLGHREKRHHHPRLRS